MQDGGGSDQAAAREAGRSGYVFMVSDAKANRRADALDVGYTRRKKARSDCKGVGPGNQKEMGKTTRHRGNQEIGLGHSR